MIDIRGIVKLLGKSKLELIFISDSSTCLYSYSIIYSESPTAPYRYPYVLLTLLYCDPSCCPLTVPTVTEARRSPGRRTVIAVLSGAAGGITIQQSKWHVVVMVGS